MRWWSLQALVGLHSRWVVGALAAFVLAAGGCAGDEEKPPEGGVETTDTAAETPEAKPAEQDSQPTQQDSGEALAARESVSLGEPVRLEVVELKRSGATAVLTFRLTLLEGATLTSLTVGGTFENGESEGAVDSNRSPTVDGISLIDTKNRKRYLVARDSEGNCVCDGELNGVSVEAGGPLVLSATFGAPPPDVDAVDVVIPTFGTFKDVPVS